ncbi:MAG: hypothetical protein NVS2B4_01260 [Ramlibacter sp.]
MPSNTKLDPTGERAQATGAMEATPISGKEHEYRADGDHRPRPDAEKVDDGTTDTVGGRAAVKQEVAPDISKGIPGAGSVA